MTSITAVLFEEIELEQMVLPLPDEIFVIVMFVFPPLARIPVLKDPVPAVLTERAAVIPEPVLAPERLYVIVNEPTGNSAADPVKLIVAVLPGQRIAATVVLLNP